MFAVGGGQHLGAQTSAIPVEVTSVRSAMAQADAESIADLGSWIWAKEVHGKQTCHFWQTFTVSDSSPVVRAQLRMTVDNEYTLYLDGRAVGWGNDWRMLSDYDLSRLMSPGPHVLAVDAYNNADSFGLNTAGVILGLRIRYADGNVQELRSDENWRLVPESEKNWQAAKRPAPTWAGVKVMGPAGTAPWWTVPLKVETIPPGRPEFVHFWQQGWFQVSLGAVCVTVVLICLRLMARVALQAKAQELLQLERARIARDLHDDLGSGLTMLVLQSEVAQRELRGQSDACVQIGRLAERARDLSSGVDEAVWAINSRRDTLRDFASYVCKHAQEFFSSSPIRCRLDVEAELPPLAFDLPLRRNLFLAVKEALNNVAKHSQATELFLRIHRHGEGLIVVVEDNGRGFDLAHASLERNGLTNMSQRLKEVDGVCRVASRPGAGSRIEFILPRLVAQRLPWWQGWRWRSNQGANCEVPQAAPSQPGTTSTAATGALKSSSA